MPLIVYLDETGDHSLELIDKDFPIFAVVFLIVEEAEYLHKIVPAIYQLKMDYFGHEAVVLHSRDIRKAQGHFGFLTDPAYEIIKKKFYQGLGWAHGLKIFP